MQWRGVNRWPRPPSRRRAAARRRARLLPIVPIPPHPSDMSNKRERQEAIRQIVESRAVGSQEELRRLLRQRGWDVTQSTLSRDLRELRLARVPTDTGVRYTLTDTGGDEHRMMLDSLLPQLYNGVDGVGADARRGDRRGGRGGRGGDDRRRRHDPPHLPLGRRTRAADAADPHARRGAEGMRDHRPGIRDQAPGTAPGALRSLVRDLWPPPD